MKYIVLIKHVLGHSLGGCEAAATELAEQQLRDLDLAPDLKPQDIERRSLRSVGLL